MRVGFSWNGLPQFAARLFRAAIDALDPGVTAEVVGSPPEVPVIGMEAALGRPVRWVDAGRPTTWGAIGSPVPDIFFQSGWRYPAFAALGAEVRARGGTVVGLSDANWRGDFRQLALGTLAFRLALSRRFEAMIVPGRQGARLMQRFGFDSARVRHGMLGADPSLFAGGPPLVSRPKTFLFVGRYAPVKNVVALGEAFVRFAAERDDWSLRLCGSGGEAARLPRHPRIFVEPFVQPEDLGARYRQARFFVLPSLVEPWGVVVHEAALSGCALLLSDRVGSADDLAGRDNALLFDPTSPASILDGLRRAAAWDDAALMRAEAASRRLASGFGPDRFAAVAAELIKGHARGRRAEAPVHV